MTDVLWTRRRVCHALGSLLVVAVTRELADARKDGPLLWAFRKGGGTVYLFPFGDADNDSWFDQRVKAAFAQSAELWLEIGQPLTEEHRKPLLASLGRLDGQTLFGVLTPRVRDRAVLYAKELEIPHEAVDRLRPWAAYYIYAAAFDRKYGHRPAAKAGGGTTAAAPPDIVLVRQALNERKTLRAELTMEQVYRRLAAMPDNVQSDYLSWLFDYFDDQLHHGNQDRFDWMHGRLASKSIGRMRSRYPELYEIMDGERNRWWTQKIGDLLTAGSNAFIAIGQNHVADSQGILTLLKRRGIATAKELER